MFKILIEKLKNDNILDETVIIGFADHPNDVYISDDETEELNKTSMFVYNTKMDPIVVNNITNTVNILPMINNLFNLDSRFYLAGYDPLSSNESYLIMPNFTLYKDGEFLDLTKEYLEKINISKDILISDYYKNN